MLYADAFYQREEFEDFHYKTYRSLLRKYEVDGGTFKEVYENMNVIW